jgi:release factor glutamine methyltransferase
LEAEILLAYLLGLPRTALWAEPEREVPAEVISRLTELCRRRAAGEPSAYLVGRKEFWSLEFVVDERVLVPRPETEHLVEEVLDRIPAAAPRIVDFGTGSGCVALTLAHERPGAVVLGIDSSSGALEVARLNARRLRLTARFHAIQARDLRALGPAGCLDGVVSNPPYIPLRRLPSLPRDVRDYEPLEALTPGSDGLEVIRHLAREAARLLAPGGVLALEIDAGSRDQVLAVLEGPAWGAVRVAADLAGHPRVVSTRRQAGPG